MAGEFVEGWLVAQVLGEGSYGEVRLLVNARTGASVALKTVRADAGGDGAAGAAREAALHRALKHDHVLRCLGERTQGPLHYMFLEYAQGGELFDRIEPDVGMATHLAKRYWRQTLLGVQYLQSRGVAHRDLKPENLLLDSWDNIKISDFGMATLYRHGGKERLLSRVCGTLPYAAPEVLSAAQRPYRAAPADLWAAAVVLLAMLAGELPWERASEDSASFSAWQSGRPSPRPWGKLGARALALFRRALHVEPMKRYCVAELLKHPWMTEDDEVDGQQESPWRGYSSQPVRGDSSSLSAADMDAMCFSQPTAAGDEIATQSERLTQGSQGVVQRLVRRATRIWVRVDEAEALAELARALRRLRAAWTRVHPRIFEIECSDGLKFRAWALRAGPEGGDKGARVLLDFRRSRGCGLAFKRKFLELSRELQHVTAEPPPPMFRDLLAPPLEPSDEAMDE